MAVRLIVMHRCLRGNGIILQATGNKASAVGTAYASRRAFTEVFMRQQGLKAIMMENLLDLVRDRRKLRNGLIEPTRKRT